MNEPEHPHFVLSDGMYCHVLEQGLIVSKKKIPAEAPLQSDRPDFVTSSFLLIAALILTFLLVMCFITGMYIVVALLGLMDAFAIIGFVRTISSSQSPFVPKADVIDTRYVKRNFGYDWMLVFYTGKDGKVRRRRYTIYDSHECLVQALDAMKSQGYLK